MLVNMNHVLRYAEEKQCCVGAFDTPNLEILMAVIRAAEKREEPVIIQHAQLHECEMPIHIIGPIMVRMAKEARVPVCVMLDHGEDLDYVRKALDLGFSAVMYDGSSLAYEENVAMTREVVAMAKACNADVEAEIGIVTGHEGKTFAINDVSDAYTDPELAARLPLVMHGGSGISVADIQRAIRCGIRKINYFSYMSNAGVKAVKKLLEEKEVKYFHDLANAAVDAMEQDVLNAMSMFALE